MEKTYAQVNGEESTALPSGEGSSMGSQWDTGLDLDVAQAIITSSFRKQGYQTSSRNVSDAQSGEMSLEEEVNSLDLKQVVIDDDEIKEMEKEQASAAIRGAQNAPEQFSRNFSSIDGHTGRENVSEERNHQTSDNDLLNDIDSLIASSLNPVDSSPVNGWMESSDGTNANGHQNTAKLNSGQGSGKHMKSQAFISSPSSSTPTDQHLQFGEDVTCQLSPSSATLIKSPSTPSDVSSQQENSRLKAFSPKLSSGIDTFQASPQTFNVQGANTQDKSFQKSNSASVESADSVSGVLEHQENMLSPSSTQCHMLNEDSLSVKDLEASKGCLMRPVIYPDDDDGESNDLDEQFSSGELIPHGRGSGRGRPKSTQPVRNSVTREIRPKTDLPVYTNNLIPVTVVVRTDDNKNCLEVHPVVSPAPHKPTPSISSATSSAPNEADSPPVDHSLLPDSVKNVSMECFEGDGPVSLAGSVHHILAPGHLPPNNHAQDVLSHRQGYRAGPQYNGTVFTQQPMHSQADMHHYIPNNHLHPADIQEQRNLHQYQGEPSLQYRSKHSIHPTQTSYKHLNIQNPRTEICMPGHQTMVSTQQPSVQAYREIHTEPSRMATPYYTEHPSEGSNLVVADPKQLEKAGIPFRIVPQASVPNHPMTQRIIQTSADSHYPHNPYLPQTHSQQGADAQPYMSLSGNSQMYQQALTGNQISAQITEQPVYNQLSKVNPAVHYRGDLQNKIQTAFYVPSSVTPNVSVESSNLPSSRIVYQVPQQQSAPMVHGTTLPSTIDPDMLLSSSKPGSSGMRETARFPQNGFHLPSRNNSARINHKLDCRGIPREDKQSRTEAWILHNMHPYESNRHTVSCSDAGPTLPPKAVGLFQGAEISVPKSGPGIKKNSGNVGDVKHKGAKKGRACGKMKEVDTINSHQGYIKKLPSKAQVNETLGFSSPDGDNLNKARLSSNESAIVDKQIDRIMAVQKGNNMPRNHTREQLNIINGKIHQDKTRSARDDFAEADKEIDKIMFEKSMRETQRKNSLDPLEKYSAMFDEPLFDYPIQSATTNQNLKAVAVTSASQATTSSQVWNIVDVNQYLSPKDKESLEKQIHLQNNSLEKYLQMGTTNDSSNSQIHLENHHATSKETQQLSIHGDESRLMGHLVNSQHQKSVQPPKEMAKIDILAWQQQSVEAGQGMPVVHRPYVAEPQFDPSHQGAHEFSQLLQSLTSPGDEDMKSASLELSSSSRNAPAKYCLNTGQGLINIPAASCSSQYHLSNTCDGHTTVLVNDVEKVPPTQLEPYFRKPHQPAVKHPAPAKYLPYENATIPPQQTSLSASISHPQPLMSSSVAMASSQPMSSIKGDSDVSMQSDLSRQSRQDRSMSSVDGKLQQIPEFLKQPHSAALNVDKGRRNQREINRVKEWLENQATFQQVSSNPKMCQDHQDTRNALTLNIPNHLDCIDHVEIPQQHQLMPEARQQKVQQEHQVLQQLAPPSSPPFDLNSPFLDHYVVPGFSPTDLTPRCGSGKSDKPPSHPQSASQTVKGTGSTPSSPSMSRAIVSDTSSNHVPTSIPSSLPTSSKQLPQNQKTAKNVTAATPNIPRPTNSVTVSSPSHYVSLSSPSAVSKGNHSQLVSSRPCAKAGSNRSSSDNSHIVNTKKSSVAYPSNTANDLHVVGEKMKTSVNISHVSRPHHEGVVAAADDEEEEEEEDVEDLREEEAKEEEEEVSFTGSDVFRPDDQGETILHCLCDIPADHFEDLASAPGFEEAVNSSNKAQETPLFVGVHNRRPDIAKFLMKKGADASIACISPANTFRNEPLLQSAVHEAAELGDIKTLNILLQSEDVDIDLPRPGSGQTPLMVALHIHSFAHRNSSADRTRVVKFLLTQGASMTIQDAVEGKTPFMYAIQSRDVEIVNTFFRLMDAEEARDAVTTKTSRSTSCLHFAAGLSNFDRSQKMELIRILILNGADASSRNAEGESPRDWARDEIDEVLKRLVPGR